MMNYRETWKQETLALARALQHCMEVPSRVLCDVAWDLQRYMVPLMHLKGDDILEASLLRATDNEPGASLTHAEEAALQGDDPTPQEAQGIITHPSDFTMDTSHSVWNNLNFLILS